MLDLRKKRRQLPILVTHEDAITSAPNVIDYRIKDFGHLNEKDIK